MGILEVKKPVTYPSSLDVDLHYPCVSTHHDVNEKPTFVLYHPADAML